MPFVIHMALILRLGKETPALGSLLQGEHRPPVRKDLVQKQLERRVTFIFRVCCGSLDESKIGVLSQKKSLCRGLNRDGASCFFFKQNKTIKCSSGCHREQKRVHRLVGGRRKREFLQKAANRRLNPFDASRSVDWQRLSTLTTDDNSND